MLIILNDYTRHDEENVRPAGIQNPRGILGATLLGRGHSTSWHIQDSAGGEKNIDHVRRPWNEGGPYGEQLDWHFPGYKSPLPASDSTPLDGMAGAEGTVYISAFRLDLDEDVDVPIGLQLGAYQGTASVVQFFMNGYQSGHYLPHIGPQTLFPFPPGMISNHSEKTFAISLWALTDAGARLDMVQFMAYGNYQTSSVSIRIGPTCDLNGRRIGRNMHELENGRLVDFWESNTVSMFLGICHEYNPWVNNRTYVVLLGMCYD